MSARAALLLLVLPQACGWQPIAKYNAARAIFVKSSLKRRRYCHQTTLVLIAGDCMQVQPFPFRGKRPIKGRHRLVQEDIRSCSCQRRDASPKSFAALDRRLSLILGGATAGGTLFALAPAEQEKLLGRSLASTFEGQHPNINGMAKDAEVREDSKKRGARQFKPVATKSCFHGHFAALNRE
eukprot:287447-Pleurochrysis_carterae.AAC.1